MAAFFTLIVNFLRALFPQAIFAFFGLLSTLLVPFLSKILAFLGLTTFTLYGLQAVQDVLKDNFLSSFDSLPADVLAIVGIMKLDVAFSLISSAVVVRRVLGGFSRSTDSISNTKILPNLPNKNV